MRQNWVGLNCVERFSEHITCYSLPPPQTVIRRHQAAVSSSSLRDDFQIISENHLLARINMKTGGDFSPGYGCGYRACLHCLRSSPSPPPPLPPKPPWLRPSRPLSLAPSSELQVETSASSEASEQEPVIYSKNVKLQNSHSQVRRCEARRSW